MRLGHRLAPLQLCLQELLWQRGVGLRQRIDAAQRQQVLGAADGVLQRAIRLVDACGGLQRQATLGLIGGSVAIGMDLAL